jgi:DNA-binding CsgD family transcriptional regulator
MQCNLSLKEISVVLKVSVDAINGRLRSCYRKTSVFFD